MSPFIGFSEKSDQLQMQYHTNDHFVLPVNGLLGVDAEIIGCHTWICVQHPK